MYIEDIKIGKDKLEVLSDFQKYLDNFKDIKKEEMIMLGFNDDCVYTFADYVTKQSEENSAYIDVKEIITKLKESKSKGCILIHNHPNGVCIPTEIDVETTKQILKEFKKHKLLLIEHYTWTNGLLWGIVNTSIKKDIYIKGAK